jgi:hypothetical protein
MPPVSVTMQPRKEPLALPPLAAPDAAAVLGALAALLALAAGALLELLRLDELLPQAATSSVAAPAATTAAANEVCFTVSSNSTRTPTPPGCREALRRSDCPEIISPRCPKGRELPVNDDVVAKSLHRGMIELY